MEKKWYGQMQCDMCKKELSKSKFFVDGMTNMGPWAVMCDDCYPKWGVGIGAGWGQQYEGKTFNKIGG